MKCKNISFLQDISYIYIQWFYKDDIPLVGSDKYACKIMHKMDSTVSRQNGALWAQSLVSWIYLRALHPNTVVVIALLILAILLIKIEMPS